MANQDRGAPAGKSPFPVLETLRLDSGTEERVLALSDVVKGLWTHWEGRNGLYCPTEKCGARRCPHDRKWKGYCPVFQWDKCSESWLPWCLEMTGTLEQHVRGRWTRGTVWRLWKYPKVGKKNPALMGELIEQRSPSLVPEPFEVLGAVRTLYGSPFVELNVKNPAPDLVRVHPVQLPAPGDWEKPGAAPKPEQVADQEAALRLLHEARNGILKGLR